MGPVFSRCGKQVTGGALPRGIVVFLLRYVAGETEGAIGSQSCHGRGSVAGITAAVRGGNIGLMGTPHLRGGVTILALASGGMMIDVTIGAP